ncbi:MAG TPA: DUF427 domain-containing protein, partial [Vicinamibacterales bacterium]|nr:DUF427 domain-containing protein [Vicinamibacterales bacterium]
HNHELAVRHNLFVLVLERRRMPYKGDCGYYSISIGGARSINAVWTYEAPYPAVAEIRGHLAFYPERADAIEEQLEARMRGTTRVRAQRHETRRSSLKRSTRCLTNVTTSRRRFWSPNYVQHSAHIEPGRDAHARGRPWLL